MMSRGIYPEKLFIHSNKLPDLCAIGTGALVNLLYGILEKHPHHKENSNDNANNCGYTVNVFGLGILFFCQVIDAKSGNQQSDNKSNDIDDHSFFLHFNNIAE